MVDLDEPFTQWIPQGNTILSSQSSETHLATQDFLWPFPSYPPKGRTLLFLSWAMNLEAPVGLEKALTS